MDTVYKLRKIFVLVIALIFITVGILRQEHIEVLQKAVKICLECIGVG
jgi:hypothetical protein